MVLLTTHDNERTNQVPNHVTTVLNAPQEVTTALLDDEGRVDFNKVIPMPDTVYRGDLSSKEEEEHPGDQNWYGWGIANWGTKWNAYQTEVHLPEEVQFDTAWAHPFPVIEALSRKFPEAEIKVVFADEDLGQNCGGYVIRNGELTDGTKFEEGSDEALNFATEIKYGTTYAEFRSMWEDDE